MIPNHHKSSRIIPNHPKSSQIIPNHPKSSRIIPNHPRSPPIIPNHPKLSQIIPDHPRSSQTITNHPRFSRFGWETSTEYHCVPTRFFSKFSMVVETSSDCGNYGSSHSTGSRANQTNCSSTPSPTWREKGAIASASWWGSLERDSVV